MSKSNKKNFFSVLEQSLTSEVMPVIISSPHKQLNPFHIVFDIHFALLGASKI